MEQKSVRTAGAYVLLKNMTIPFVIGPTKDHQALAVIRLGGHRENNESAWQCAEREVYEESQLRISHLVPSTSSSRNNNLFCRILIIVIVESILRCLWHVEYNPSICLLI